jgi:microsomal dipeptidase-like Zn-dependent dipeptidase
MYIRTFLGDVADLSSMEDKYQVTLPRLREGNFGCLFMNVGDMDLLTSAAVLDNVFNVADNESNKISICYTADGVGEAVASGKLSVVLSCESHLLFLQELSLLRNWNRLGVRVASLSHGEGTAGLSEFAARALQRDSKVRGDAAYALQVTPSTDAYMTDSDRNELHRREKGLTEFGRLALHEMTKLGMICDLSHANDAAFWEAIELSHGRLCCTHSNCASLCCHGRNLTDSMMEALAGRGGVMGLCFYGEFIDQSNPSLKRYVQHILHAIDVMGPDHVGIGSDFDGVPPDAFMAVPHPGRMNDLWSALEEGGLDEATIRKIAHENFLRLLS